MMDDDEKIIAGNSFVVDIGKGMEKGMEKGMDIGMGTA